MQDLLNTTIISPETPGTPDSESPDSGETPETIKKSVKEDVEKIAVFLEVFLDDAELKVVPAGIANDLAEVITNALSLNDSEIFEESGSKFLHSVESLGIKVDLTEEDFLFPKEIDVDDPPPVDIHIIDVLRAIESSQKNVQKVPEQAPDRARRSGDANDTIDCVNRSQKNTR